MTSHRLVVRGESGRASRPRKGAEVPNRLACVTRMADGSEKIRIIGVIANVAQRERRSVIEDAQGDHRCAAIGTASLLPQQDLDLQPARNGAPLAMRQ